MGDGGNKILFVDDDARFREAVTRCLRLGDDYECFIAKNGWDALEIMGREDIHLVISDIRMPGMTGLHLMSEIRTRHPEVDVILMTGFATDQLRNKIKRTDCLYLLEKPFSLKHLRQLIHDNIAKKSKGFNGTLKNIQLIDLLQMCTLSGVSIAINVTKDDLKGSILIKKGKIIHAEHKEQKGTNAFFEILSWENGNFETLTLPHEAPGTIDSQSMYLLMEAARRSDEKNKAARERERAGEKRAGETRAGEKADAPRTGIVRRVLVVEDSPMMCGILKGMLDADPDIEVVGTAKNGDEALKKIDALEPDLITLDVNMPVMDGGTALKHIMMKKACPVVIISSPRANAQENIIDFLRLGAVEFISKPRKNEGAEYRERLVKRIKLAAEANIGAFRRVPPQKILTGETPDAEARTPCRRLVIFLSGIGGCAELIKAIPPLPESRDASLLVFQSMSSDLISPLSEYLDKRSRCKITPSRSGARLYGGACYISNDDLLLKYATIGDVRFLSDADVRAGAAPGVGAFDYFLDSIPGSFADRVLVALLSGARADGLDGLKRFKEKGGRIIAQDPDACMAPRLLEEAAEAGLIEQSARSDEIADRIRSWRDG